MDACARSMDKQWINGNISHELHWLGGKILTRNHGFYHEIWVFPVKKKT